MDDGETARLMLGQERKKEKENSKRQRKESFKLAFILWHR